MGAARPGDREVTLAQCRDPGFTPGVRDVAGVLALWHHAAPDAGSSKELAKTIVRALGRGDQGVARSLHSGWPDADGPQRVLRLRALARIAQRIAVPTLVELLEEALEDSHPPVVREAARAVGKLDEQQGGGFEARLLAVWRHAALPERRAAADALGRVGGASARVALDGATLDDADLGRRAAHAVTLIERRIERCTPSRVVLDRPLPRPSSVRLRCRRGAVAVLQDQVDTMLSVDGPTPARRDGDGAVVLPWAATLGELYRVRSFVDPALEFALPPGASLVDRVVGGLGQSALVQALVAWTDGPVRFRLMFGRGGRRRAAIREVAQRLSALGSPLINDSREAPWTVEIDEPGERLACIPRDADPRFAYRRADVPAATHPTLAALMAWVGRPVPGEVVWDPFCGSGSELVECARLCDGLHLWGSDIDPGALSAARENLAAANIDAASLELRGVSALDVTPHHGSTPVSLILSNPPMGRRVMVEGTGMRRLLADFVAHAAAVLRPGGRMVWLSPAPYATANAGRRAGLEPHDLDAIDMGGFFTTPQVLRKPG